MNDADVGVGPVAWERLGWSGAFGSCLLWGLGFGLLEAAYFTRVNEMFPLGLGHVALVLLLTLEYAAVAAIAPAFVWITRRAWGSLALPLAHLGAPWLLGLILAVSHYRDRVVLHARRKEDLLVTAILVLVLLALWLGLAVYLRSRDPRSPRRALTILALAVIVGGGAWLGTARSGWTDTDTSQAVTAAEAGPVDETGLKVLIVGLDGGVWSVLDPLLEAGRLPALAGMMSRGRSARVKTIEPTFSPIIWTSVATGKGYEKHRILSHVYTQPPFGLPGIPHDPKRIKNLTKVMKLNVRGGHALGLLPMGIYASTNLHARQIWDVVGEFGLPTVSIEWYVTHPVRPVRGVEVSDQLHLLKDADPDRLSKAVWPDSLAPVLQPLVIGPDELPRSRLEDFLDVDDLDAEGRDRLAEQFPGWYRMMGSEMARDLSTDRIMHEVFPRVPDWRLGAVYYRAMDSSHHVTWRYRGLPAEGVDEHPERRFRDVVDRYAVFCDGLLRDTLELADENTVVIVLSDHGWEDQLWGHKRKPDGFFVMAGGPVIPSSERGDVTIFDIAPTALAVLGIPVPEDMDGRVLTEWIDPAFLAEHPIRSVPSYDHENALLGAVGPDAVDERILEQLRGLGYIGN